MDPKKLSRINAMKSKRLKQRQELILQHNLKVFFLFNIFFNLKVSIVNIVSEHSMMYFEIVFLLGFTEVVKLTEVKTNITFLSRTIR